MTIVGRVTSKGQTTIPKSVRDALGIESGSRIEWKLGDGMVAVVPSTRRMIDLAGLLGDPLSRPSSIEEMDTAASEEVARHVLGDDQANHK